MYKSVTVIYLFIYLFIINFVQEVQHKNKNKIERAYNNVNKQNQYQLDQCVMPNG